MSESLSLRKQIINAIGEAARYGDIHGDGDGNTSMSFESWFALRSHLSVILAAAHAKGRAEGIGEAVAVADGHAAALEGNPSTCGESVARGITSDIRALLTTGGTDAKR